jgi:hypothetical protein
MDGKKLIHSDKQIRVQGQGSAFSKPTQQQLTPNCLSLGLSTEPCQQK